MNISRFNQENLNQLGTTRTNSKVKKSLLGLCVSKIDRVEINDQETSNKREKEMIEKQLKLIEMRRMELMQQSSKGSIGVGINTITNLQWDRLTSDFNLIPHNAINVQKKYLMNFCLN